MKEKVSEQNIFFRRFKKKDIGHKVNWVNDDKVNEYLHYDLPLCEERTLNWYNEIIDDNNRLDCVIEYTNAEDQFPIGLIGLMDIDRVNSKAEFYIMIGEKNFWGTSAAEIVSEKFLDFGFKKYNLNKVYLYTEKENRSAINLFEKLGFKKEGLLRDDIIYMSEKIDRYYYGLLREEFYNE